MPYKPRGSFRPLLCFSHFPVHLAAEMLASSQDSVSKSAERVSEEVARLQAGGVGLAMGELRLENSDFGARIDNYFLMPKERVITLRRLVQSMPGVVAPIRLSFKVGVSLPNYLYTH